VCGADPLELATLVDESLLERADERFHMLETVREYALERLVAPDAARARHAEHFLALAEEAEPELTVDPRGAWLQRLEAEHANLRAALTWSAGTAPDLRLVAALARFWIARGHLREARSWLDAALARDGAPELRAKALAGAASVAFWQGDYTAVTAFAGEGLALSELVGDR